MKLKHDRNTKVELRLDEIVPDLVEKRRQLNLVADSLSGVDRKKLEMNFNSFLRRYYGENGALIEVFLTTALEPVKKQFFLNLNNGFLEKAFRDVQTESEQIKTRHFNTLRRRVRELD